MVLRVVHAALKKIKHSFYIISYGHLMSWDLSRGGPTHDEIGLGHPGVSFTRPKSLAWNIYICIYIRVYIYICVCVYMCMYIYIYVCYTKLYMWYLFVFGLPFFFADREIRENGRLPMVSWGSTMPFLKICDNESSVFVWHVSKIPFSCGFMLCDWGFISDSTFIRKTPQLFVFFSSKTCFVDYFCRSSCLNHPISWLRQ